MEILIALYVWTILLLVGDKAVPLFKEKSLGKQILYASILFGIVFDILL
jgi:hypothetical protein